MKVGTMYCVSMVNIYSKYLVNTVLKLCSRGVQFFFSGPAAGLTNWVPVRNFDPSAPLGLSSGKW